MSPALGCIDPSSYRLTIEGEILKISETELADRLENVFDFDQIFLSSAAITRNKKDLCEIDSLWTH